jgi:hypothetical protein
MSRNTLRCLGAFVLALATFATPLHAQEAPVAPAPQNPGLFHRSITWVTDKLESRGDGFYTELGHMIPGAGGIKAGPGYRRHLFHHTAILDTSAAMSLRRYSMTRTSLEWPAAFSDRVSLGGDAGYQNATQISYFGIGARSDADARTTYRLRNLDVSGWARVRANHWLSVAGRAGMARVLDVGPGLDPRTPSIEQQFDDRTAPGLRVAPRYQHADVRIEADSRDVAGYPTRGGLYRVSATAFRDADRSGQSFRRIETEAVHYLPLLRSTSSLAVRGRVMLSQTSRGNTVPFYLLPTLGGGQTLRGYADYRFRDRHAAIASAEYRWRVFRLMDAAMFTDVGTVAASARGLLHERAIRDFGLGVRVHSPTRTIGRVDVARGHEGTRMVVSLLAPFGSPRREIVPYIP